ncbi:MAG: TIGR02452 family protein [Candidatus Bipolaricaulota bacterium]|nr:TIGR02452 family protein [Candidatus Bipolaricaulota bacterium]MBS3791968.1 TIGR02452 family protein [Candidatus Bipolaricaulota bacterium]
MTTRKQRSKIAHETVEVLESGHYETEAGKLVDIESELKYAVENTKLYRPRDLERIQLRGDYPGPLSLKVTNERTLEAAKRLENPGTSDPFVLNFASGRNPGGGFLNGSGAQEESLARATGLYHCISDVTEYYQKNRQSDTGLYTDNMIYSPRVPVIRDGDGNFLESPFSISILTAPAVNRKAIEKNDPERLSEVKPTMDDRIKKVLLVAADNNHRELVLGAWGCGVFDNDPRVIAKLFRKKLEEGKTFNSDFEKAVFAVPDEPSVSNYKVFKEVLES